MWFWFGLRRKINCTQHAGGVVCVCVGGCKTQRHLPLGARLAEDALRLASERVASDTALHRGERLRWQEELCRRHLRRDTLNLRLKDLLGPVTRVKKNKKGHTLNSAHVRQPRPDRECVYRVFITREVLLPRN